MIQAWWSRGPHRISRGTEIFWLHSQVLIRPSMNSRLTQDPASAPNSVTRSAPRPARRPARFCSGTSAQALSTTNRPCPKRNKVGVSLPVSQSPGFTGEEEAKPISPQRTDKQTVRPVAYRSTNIKGLSAGT